MDEDKKKNLIEECKLLENKLKIIRELPEEVLERYNYDFNKIINKIEKYKDNDSQGEIYKIHNKGYIDIDGYEENYLFMCKGSSLERRNVLLKEQYVRILNDGSDDYICYIDKGSTAILPIAKGNTVVKCYRYIPKEM